MSKCHWVAVKRQGIALWHDSQWVLWLLLFSLPWLTAFAEESSNQEPVSALTILQNVSQQVPALMRLVTAITYVMGFYFIFWGILRLKQFGEQRTMMTAEHHLKGPLVLITVGSLLLYLPTSVEVGLSTFWTNPTPYAYVTQQSSPWGELFKDCFVIIQLFGTIAFIRGLLLLGRLAGQGQMMQGNFGKAMTHIIGGIFCINIYQFVQMIFSTLGLPVQFI